MMQLQQALAWLPGARLVGDVAVVLDRVHSDTPYAAAGRPVRGAQGRQL